MDAKDAHNQGATRAIAEHKQAGHQFSVPTTVLAETMVGTARRGREAVDRVYELLEAMFGPTRVIDEAVALEAAHLRAKHKSLRLPDALVIATGIVDEADTILTADKRWESIDKRVEVLTPTP
jgi:predicted nucleic acid-binding protein